MDTWVQEKYVSCWKLFHCYQKLQQQEEGMYYLVESIKFDATRGECLHILISYYGGKGMNNVAYGYFSVIKNFYENEFLHTDSCANKLFVDISKLSMHIPYWMILVADKMQDFATVILMYRVIFTKKFKEHSKHIVGNMLFNLQFFIHRPEAQNDPTFNKLFVEYVDYLISYGYPVEEHASFMRKYEPYGLKIFKKERKFTKEECKQSNKIMFYTGFASSAWNYTYSLMNALGGSESAVAYLAKELPSNYEIIVAGAVDKEVIGNVTYLPLDQIATFLRLNPIHTIIVSRYLAFFEMFPHFSSYQNYIWGHDISLIHYGSTKMTNINDILEKWKDEITGCICQTKWHKEAFIRQYPSLREKITTINNGINKDLIDSVHALKIKTKPNRFIYTSCAERGLSRIVELWPCILSFMPDAELVISSYNTFPNIYNQNEVELKVKMDSFGTSIKHVGKLSKIDLYTIMLSCEYWLYPTSFDETSCITAMEMMALDVVCLYYPRAGLADTMGDYGIQVHYGNEIETLMEISSDTQRKEDMKTRAKEYAYSCAWSNRSKEWTSVLQL